MDDDLTLKVRGAALSGWTEVALTRGIERCPSSFDVQMTEFYPGQATDFVVQPGDSCQVYLGADLVATGYVDLVAPEYDEERHTLRITGRGKCQDLVDASAEWAGGQISGTSALDIATKLAAPYGITVTAPDGAGPAIPQFNFMLGETAYEIIERVCRFAQLLAYEGPDGNLILAQVGDNTHASGIAEGQNIQKGRAEYNNAERFSEYDGWELAMDTYTDVGNGGNLQASVKDPGVTRNRKHYIIADSGGQGLALLQPRVVWEMNRRVGRGNQVWATVDSWRDSAGLLWQPNYLLPVIAPNLKTEHLCSSWVIGDVTYYRDDKGTHADLRVCPPTAFQPEPILLQPFYPDLAPPPGPGPNP